MRSVALAFVTAGVWWGCGGAAPGLKDGGPGDGGPDDVAVDAGVDVPAGEDATLGDAPGDAAVACTPSEKKCLDATKLSVCSEAGDHLTVFDCPTGCAADACKEADLMNGWQVYQFKATDDSIQTPSKYTYENEGRVAIESENALPSAYVNDHVFGTLHATGKISVQTTSDDDLIGFVFGWQDMSHFYLLDWKKAEQNDGTCGLAKQGVTLKRMIADSEPLTCDNYWASAGTASVGVLSPTTGAGWVTGTVYAFDLVWKPGFIRITLKDGDTVIATISSDDAMIATGRFGFWNYSQAAVRYESFIIEPAP